MAPRLSHARGALAGLALGDALGMPTQEMSPAQIRAVYGRITGLVDGDARGVDAAVRQPRGVSALELAPQLVQDVVVHVLDGDVQVAQDGPAPAEEVHQVLRHAVRVHVEQAHPYPLRQLGVQRREQAAGTLSGGEQQMLAMGRALMSRPKLLLLDEPAAGMNPQETQELMEMIRWIKKEFGLTILLIEHDMSLVMGICERIYVLEYGEIIAEGTPKEIKENPEVIRAYLGGEA